MSPRPAPKPASTKRIVARRRGGDARGDPPGRRTRGVLRLHARRRGRDPDGARRRARRRARACSRCPASRGAARCSCTTIRRGCSSRRAPTTTSPRACTTTASDSGSSTTTRRSSTSSSRCRRAESPNALDPTRVGARPRSRRRDRARARALRGSPEPARDGGDDRARLQRRRRRAARGGHRRRQVARLSRARAALGGGEQRAHDRVDEHDQPAGAARRQGSAVSREGAERSAGALRAAQGVAQLSLLVAARAGDGRRGALFDDGMADGARRDRRRGRSARTTDRSPTCRRRRAPRCGTRSRPRRTCARA